MITLVLVLRRSFEKPLSRTYAMSPGVDLCQFITLILPRISRTYAMSPGVDLCQCITVILPWISRTYAMSPGVDVYKCITLIFYPGFLEPTVSRTLLLVPRLKFEILRLHFINTLTPRSDQQQEISLDNINTLASRR